MKIIFFLNEIKYSGASKMALWVASKLAEDYHVTILTIHAPEAEVKQRLRSVLHVDSLYIDKCSRWKLFGSVIRKLRRYINDNQIDIAFGFHPLANLELLVASILTRTQIIVCERSDPWLEKAIIPSFCRWTYRFGDFAVFQTEAAKKYYPHSLQRRSMVIPNPAIVGKKNIVPYEKRNNKVVHVSRIYFQQKRQDLLLEAFSIFHKKCGEAKLYIYGDGPDEEKLISLVKQLELEESVVICGKTNEPLEVISDARLFVLTSDYEGIPNVIIEALSVGVPCVSTDCSPGGARVLIVDGENGFVVHRNDPYMLARKMEDIYLNESLAEKMAHNAPSVIELFSEKTIAPKWRQVIERVRSEIT